MEKSRVLVLGAGFSKAFHCDMPLLKDIADYFEEKVKDSEQWVENSSDPVSALRGLSDPLFELLRLSREPYQTLLTQPESFELLLTYLNQEQPWKSNSDILQDRALFKSIAEHLGVYIEKRQTIPFLRCCQEQSSWLHKLTGYLNEQEMPVITFNYDTLIEWTLLWISNTQSTQHQSDVYIDEGIYGVPLSPLATPQGDPFSKINRKTLQLIKLHGSINWFFHGGSSAENFYYYPISKTFCYPGPELVKSKVPLIIPPILDKTPFYNHPIIRSLWRDAKFYLEIANEIFCVGYSMPLTDLTTRLLFQSLSKFPGKTVYIVNLSDNRVEADELKKRYEMAFPKQKIDERFLLPQACRPVERMVEFLTGG